MLRSPSEIVDQDLEYIRGQFDDKGKFEDCVILATGCAGFVGFYLMHFLSRYSKEFGIRKIIGVDNFKLGRPEWLDTIKSEYPDTLMLHDFDIAKDEIHSLGDVEKANFVIHMASIASPVFYRKYPLETVDANIWGLRKLLDYFKDRALSGSLFFSSSEIYGDPPPEHIPTTEDYKGSVSTLGPRACYDESKRFGETLCYIFAKQYDFPITIVRPFNNFGPGMKLNDGRVPIDFGRSVIQNADIIIHSDGSPRRTFCYISDAMVGFLKALTYGRFDYFNIGIDKPEISVNELAETYLEHGRKIFGYTGRIRFERSADHDYLTHSPTRRCPNIDKARRLLNFNPHINVREGVGRFLQFLAKGEV